MIDEKLEHIKLQSAHVTQHTVSGVKGFWSVEENITNEVLQTFPPNISDELMFSILDFARKFELDAFNAGIRLQKNKQNEYLVQQISLLKNANKECVCENERLSTILEKYIGE